MALQGAIARRYAEAVFEMGRNTNGIERWRTDIQLLAEYLRDRRLAFVLSEPNVAFSTKEAMLRDLLSDKVQPDALGLALVLVDQDQVSMVPRIVTEFERLYDEYKNQAQATIITATPLDAAETAQLAAALQKMTGKQITLTTEIDPTILGGVVARVGDTLIDGSVRRRLALLREQIINGNLPAETK